MSESNQLGALAAAVEEAGKDLILIIPFVAFGPLSDIEGSALIGEKFTALLQAVQRLERTRFRDQALKLVDSLPKSCCESCNETLDDCDSDVVDRSAVRDALSSLVKVVPSAPPVSSPAECSQGRPSLLDRTTPSLLEDHDQHPQPARVGGDEA